MSEKDNALIPAEKNTEDNPVVRNKYADKMNRKSRKLNKKVSISIAVVLLLAIVLSSVLIVKNILNSQKDSDIGRTSYTMLGNLETFVSGWGNVSPKTQSDLGKSTKGTVTSVNFKSGDEVKAGDVIFSVDPSATKKELDTALSELDNANTTLKQAKSDLDGLVITAPFNGKIVAVEDIKKGQQLGGGSNFATIADDSIMKLPLYFSYGYIDQLKVGMSAVVSIPQSMSTVNGTVESIEKIKKVSNDGTVLFKAVIKIKNPGTLSKDMVATATISSSSGDIVPADSGKLEYNREEVITSKSAGEIIELNASEFYEYKAGAVLCRLTNDSLVNAVTTANRSITTATERVNELRKSIAESNVVSPIDGIITAMLVKEGDELSGSGTAVVTVSDLSTLIVDAEIDETNISKVSVGMPVTITTEQMDGTLETVGEVISVSFSAKSDNNNQGGMATFPAQFQIDNTEGKFRPGQGVDYKISASLSENCVMVETGAIVYTQDGSAAVYAKPMEGQTFENSLPIPEGANIPEGFYLVPVTIGISDENNCEITSGLDADTEVFLAGPSDYYEDMYGSSGGMSSGEAVAVG